MKHIQRSFLVLLIFGTLAHAEDTQDVTEANSNNLEDEVITIEERLYEEQENGAQFDPRTGKRMYDGYKVIRVQPETQEDLEVLKFLAKGLVELWTDFPSNVSFVDKVDILVNPQNAKHVENFLECSGLKPEVIIENLQEQIDEENIPSPDFEDTGLQGRPAEPLFPYPAIFRHLEKRDTPFGGFLKTIFNQDRSIPPPNLRAGRHLSSNSPNLNLNQADFLRPAKGNGFCFTRAGMNWGQYHRLDTMNRYIDCLADDHRDKVEIIEIGRSFEGRSMRVLKLGRPSKILKKAVWIDGGIHAREWVSPAAVLYLVRELVENEDPENSILNNFDIYVLPVANPDGYEYSHQVDRMWRKTRSNGNGACRGVDPNRNWGYRWGGEGASSSPCSETYRGPRPFSEPETAAIRDFIMSRNSQMELYLTFHSFGQYILYPWGYATEDTEDSRELHSMGLAAASAMQRVAGRSYSVGSAAKLLYPASGGSDDWAKGHAGIKYSYTIELPDTGRHGFILPAKHIESVGHEVHAGVMALVNRL